MDTIIYVVSFLSCAITLGNVLVAGWEASKNQARFASLEERLARVERIQEISQCMSKR